MGLFGPDPEVASLRRRVARLEAVVEELSRQLGAPVDLAPAIPQEVRSLVAGGKKIQAIKVLREQTGMGLREAKETVEGL